MIGIDIGTSQAKGGVFDENGGCLARGSASYRISSPYPTWSETDPEEWWKAIKDIIGQVLSQARVKAGDIGGISISSLVPCCVPIDRRGTPLRKAILWLDRRTEKECKWLEENIGLDKCMKISGNRINPYYWGPKVLWFKNNEPKLFAKTWKLLQAHSYPVFKLTGETVTDFSCGGLCVPLYDYRKKSWSSYGCEVMGVPPEILPQLKPSFEVVGQVSEVASREVGLKKGTLVVTGCGDFAASTLGAGVIEEGEACVMLGTAGNLLIPMKEPKFDSRMINSAHAVAQRFITFANSFAGGSLQWFLNLLKEPRDKNLSINSALSYELLDLEASLVKPGSEGLVFLPHLAGELTLDWNPKARGVFFGLNLNHTRAHMFRAILEAIGYRYRHMLEIVESQGISVREATLINGGGKSKLWRQILADITGLTLLYTESEGAPLGNAILAGMGMGIITDAGQTRSWFKVKDKNEPNLKNYHRYTEYFKLYQELYLHLKKDFEHRYKICPS